MGREYPISVLIVEDVADLRELLVDSLKEAGFSVTEADGGDDALKMVTQRDFDVVVSDIQMPRGDGVSLLNRIKEVKPALPVLLMTGGANLSGGGLEKAEAVLQKPFDHKVLIEAIHLLLR